MVEPWPKKKIGEILDFKNGLNKGKSFFGHGTPIVNYMDVYHHCGLKAADIKGKVSLSPSEISRYDVEKNDVFFTRTSETPEEVGISSVLLEDIGDCVFSGFVLRGRPKNDCLSPNYCKYCFSTKQVRDEIVRHCTYTTRALTNGKQLSAIEIPIPPLPEQEAIAETITAFDTHIENLSALIEKKRAVRDGALEDLMRGKIRLSGFSGQWNESILGEIGVFIKGAPLSRADISNSGTPMILYGELYTTYNEIAYKIYRCTNRIVDEIFYSQVGDIVIPTSGETAEEIATATCVMVPGVILAGDLNIFRTKVIDGRFLSLAINHVVNRQISEVAQGISIVHINAKELNKILVKYPSRPEQEAIASAITAMDREIAALEEERDKMAQIREGAMDDLLTGRVRLKA